MGLSLPREPSTGEQVKAGDVGQIIRAIKYLAAEVGKLWAEILTLRRARGSSEAIRPFTLSGSVVDSTAFITVFPGLVDDFVPTVGGIFLDALTGEPPAPPKITVTGAAGQLWCKCGIDANGVIVSVIVETGASMPANSSTFVYRRLGSFTFASGAFTSITSLLNANQYHFRCNGASTWGTA